MATDIVNESSVLDLEAKFTTNTRQPVVPESVRYLIKDVTNDRIVRDWTTVTPAQTINIQVTSTENDIYGAPVRRYFFEERVISVQANYDTDTQYADEYRYLIKNLWGFDS